MLGARGGKAFGRNERIRRALLPKPPPATVSLPAVPRHTVAEAVAALDACFPWLRGARKAIHAPRSGHPWRRESRVSFGRATPEQVLTAVQIELALIVKRLIAPPQPNLPGHRNVPQTIRERRSSAPSSCWTTSWPD